METSNFKNVKVTFHIWLMRRKNYYNPTKKAQTNGNHCCFRFSFPKTDWFPLSSTWHFLQGLEGYSRHPRFDRRIVGDLGKRKISWRDMEFARYSGCGMRDSPKSWRGVVKEGAGIRDETPYPPTPPAPFQNLFISITNLIPRAFAPRSYFLRGWGWSITCVHGLLVFTCNTRE